MPTSTINFPHLATVRQEISGTTATITATPGGMYKCGTLTSLSFTPSSVGVCDVIFTSGSTATTVTLPATVKMPPYYLIEANKVYEINISDGIYGEVSSWTL